MHEMCKYLTSVAPRRATVAEPLASMHVRFPPPAAAFLMQTKTKNVCLSMFRLWLKIPRSSKFICRPAIYGAPHSFGASNAQQFLQVCSSHGRKKKQTKSHHLALNYSAQSPYRNSFCSFSLPPAIERARPSFVRPFTLLNLSSLRWQRKPRCLVESLVHHDACSGQVWTGHLPSYGDVRTLLLTTTDNRIIFHALQLQSYTYNATCF